MIGKSQLQLGAEQLMSGMSSSDFATDGALGIDSFGLNPFVVPGAMYSLASPTDISSNVVDNIIATCADFQSSSAKNRFLVGDAANFYSYNGSSVTKQASGSASYVVGKTDITPFNGSFYATQGTVNITKWNGSSSLMEAWYTSLSDATAPHPLLNYINAMYIGDGNVLKNLNTSGSINTSLTLPPDEIIHALGIDPLTGQMLISTQKGYDISDTLTSAKFVYLYDGVSAEYTRKIPVDDLVTAFIPFQGQVICGIGYSIGIWNGNGITFLRLLKNTVVSNGNADLPYKHHFTVTGRILHVIDGPVILSYAPVVSQKPAFFYTAYEQTNTPPSYHLTAIFNCGKVLGDRIAIAYDNTAGNVFKVFSFDFGSLSAGLGNLYFNNIYFPRPVYIRGVRVITTGITTGSAGSFTFEDQNNLSPVTQNFSVPSNLAPSSGSTQYLFEFDYSAFYLQAIQPRLSWSSQGFGVIRFIIYYDVKE